jgi:hypothetical protein
MNKSENIANLATALSAFQNEVKQPMKSADNPFFKSKYVPLEYVVEAINEIAHLHGLSFTQWATNDEHNRIGVSTMVMHTSGEWIEYPPIYMKSEKDTAQGAGSVITYAKRYALSAVFGITSDVDDDGNVASGNKSDKAGKPKVEPVDISIERLKDAYEELDRVQIQEKTFSAVYEDLISKGFTHEMILEAINKKKKLAEKGIN